MTSPDGGRQEHPLWVLVAAATLASAVALGSVTSHGVLVAVLMPATIVGVSAGAALVAVSSSLQFGLGPFVGDLADRFGVARVLVLAAIAYGLGVGLAAVSSNLSASVLAYASGTGVAGACTLAPLLAAAAGWHIRWRSVAVALVSAGNGLGALLLAPSLAAGIQRFGLAATWSTLAVVGTTSLLLSARVLRRAPISPARVLGAGEPQSVIRTVFRDPGLRRFYLAGVIGSAGVIGTLTYLVVFAIEVGYPPSHAAALLGLVSAAGLLSRLAVTVIPVGRTFVAYRTSKLLIAASAAAWMLAPQHPGWMLGFVVVFGMATGLWSALAPLVVAQAHPERLGSILGLIYTSPAVGGLIGPVVVSVVLAVGPLRDVAWSLAGLSVVAAALLRPLVTTERSESHRRTAATSLVFRPYRGARP